MITNLRLNGEGGGGGGGEIRYGVQMDDENWKLVLVVMVYLVRW